jgi:hypothetical protein
MSREKIRHPILANGEPGELANLLDDYVLDEIETRAVLINILRRIDQIETMTRVHGEAIDYFHKTIVFAPVVEGDNPPAFAPGK